MKIFILIVLFVCTQTFAQTVSGLTVGNSHQVDKDGQVFRGKEPKKLVSELKSIGITDVLIFKNEVKTEVTTEISDLKKLGIKPHHVPFRWKDFNSNQEACEQVVTALNLISKTKDNGGSIFFHCTAGEDRTGMLAGLFRMLDEGLSRDQVFKKEMCAKGYSDGNPHKPGMVTGAIQRELTPLFIALAAKIEAGDWKLGAISKKSCKNLQVAPTKLKCKK
jgi:hypothetical protein